MKVSTQTLDNCEVLLTVELDEAQKEKLLQKAAQRISKQAKIPGFRPGKAPYKLVVNQFGLETIQQEALEDINTQIFQEALKEAKITPYAMASLDTLTWEPLVMTVKIPVDPIVELGNYRDLRLEIPPIEISAEEIETQLTQLHQRYITFTPVDRPVEPGDLVAFTISQTDTATGTVIEAVQPREITVTSPVEQTAEPDWALVLAGALVDDEKTFTHTYAADYTDHSLAGKTVEITVKITAVKVKEEPSIDDEFASLVGDFDTLAALKAKIENDLRTQKQYQIDQQLANDMLVRIVETAKTIRWPQVAEDQELDHALEHEKEHLTKRGIDLDIYLKTIQKTLDEFKEDLRKNVRQDLKTNFALSKIVELENLTLDNEELAREINFMTMIYGNTQQVKKYFQSPAGINSIANTLLTNKARQRLAAIARGEAEAIVEPSAPSADQPTTEVPTEETQVEPETVNTAEA